VLIISIIVLISLPQVELVDAGGIHADGLGGTDDIEAHVAHGDGREAAVDIVLAVAVNHVECAPLLLVVAAPCLLHQAVDIV